MPLNVTEQNNTVVIVEEVVGSVTISDDPTSVTITEEAVSVAEVATTGPQGPPGPGDKNFVFTQGTPLATWTITHNLDKRPAVVVVDSAETVVVGEIEYVDDNSVVLTFSSGFSGKAYLN